MSKHLRVSLIILFLLVTAISYYYQTFPANTSNSLPTLFDKLELVVLAEDWSEAASIYAQISSAFNRSKYLIMLNNAEQDFNAFETSLSQIRGGLLAQDKVSVLSQLSVAKDLWGPLTQLIPRP